MDTYRSDSFKDTDTFKPKGPMALYQTSPSSTNTGRCEFPRSLPWYRRASHLEGRAHVLDGDGEEVGEPGQGPAHRARAHTPVDDGEVIGDEGHPEIAVGRPAHTVWIPGQAVHQDLSGAGLA